MKMKMKYTEQAVETLDDAGSVIANKNIEIEQLRQRVAELEAVLRECREAFVKNIVGTGGRTQAMHEAILKIDEVLK